MSQQIRVKEHFDTTAQAWSESYHLRDFHSLCIQRRRQYVLEMVDRVIKNGKGKTVLDLGCGSGELCHDLAHRGFDVLGVDIAPAMIELARSRCVTDRARFQCASVYDAEYPEQSFDLVTALGFIEYLPHDRWVVQRMMSWLKPGGLLVVTIPNQYRLTNWICVPLERLWIKVLRPLLRPTAPPISPEISRFVRNKYKPSDIEDMLLENGCEIVRTLGHNFGPFKIGARNLLPQALQRGWYFLADSLSHRQLVPGLGRLGSDFIVCARKRAAPPWRRLEALSLSEKESWDRVWEKRYAPYMRRNNVHPWSSCSSPRPLDISGLGKKIMVVAPHQDDEIIGVGGTLLQAVQYGAEVHVVYITNGCQSAGFTDEVSEDLRRTIRMDEARAVCNRLGFVMHVLGIDSHEEGIQGGEEVCPKLIQLLKDLQPSSVFVPSPKDSHPEHRDCYDLFIKASRQAAWSGTCLAYEIWGFVEADFYCGMAGHFDMKASSLEQYVTGMRAYNYVAHCFSLGLFRSSTLLKKAGLVEGFQEIKL